YMTPMLRASQEKDPLVKSNDVPILFHHLPTLIGLSSRILATRTSAPDKRPMDFLVPSLGHQWLQFQEEWVVFLKYAVHFEVNTKSIKRACTNGLLLKIEQESLTRRDTKRMGMADYLIAPIQRVPRYCLLLKDLLKYTPTTHDDYWDLVKVFDTMTGLARAMNDTQKLHRRKTTMA
ncbi:Dbl homology domain-containing protein, partial [Halteromyces radiatus]|uniref:Dbl homology domain-containing protein n=1 Tax=Halteromyces radiatus TaxID=101107 RepID=UPI002220EFB7